MCPIYAFKITTGKKRFIENPLLGSEKLKSERAPHLARQNSREIIRWFIEDRFVRLGLRRKIWKDIGTAGPLDPR
ncbi:hypothetical protein CWR43_30295 [Rhizobium sullae]|uniref:Uncharacterized protein n=2 Tax=Rhizobium sullae TaxID=50338 RepID=A0A2N0D1M3_RHISU|nr:hypothetical protein CWR43_30295 [Rhizobium sullae]